VLYFKKEKQFGEVLMLYYCILGIQDLNSANITGYCDWSSL